MSEIDGHEKMVFAGVLVNVREFWSRREASMLPVFMTKQMRVAAQEPLLRSDQLRDSMGSSLARAGEAGGIASVLSASIMLQYQPGGRGSRIRLKRNVYDLWLPYFPRPTPFEMHRPWAYCFCFENSAPGNSQCYGWTTLAMLGAVHWWIQANDMFRGKVARIFVCFDGNFDVIWI